MELSEHSGDDTKIRYQILRVAQASWRGWCFQKGCTGKPQKV